MRPSKITANLVNTIEKVLNDKDIVVLTDEELVMFLNEELPENEQISLSSFAHWKSGKLPTETADAENIKRFLHVIKKALYVERLNLMKELKKDSQWQRYAWILERKFKEWNLKRISELDVTSKGDKLNNLSGLSTDELIKRAEATKKIDESS
jgi:hypothetical protein